MGTYLTISATDFSQFCILSSIVDQSKENRKVRDFSKFSSRSFIADLIQVDWDEIIARGTAFTSGRRHSTLNKKTPLNKPIVSIVFLVLLSFCLLLLYVSCVFYTK